MKTCHSVVIAAHAHLGFEDISSLIEREPGYIVSGYESHPPRLMDTLAQHNADLLLMCYRFCGESPVDAITHVKQTLPRLSVLIVSAQPRTFEEVTRLYDAGANAFLCSTTANRKTLFSALESATAGQQYYTNSYRDKLIETTVVSIPPASQNGSTQELDRSPTLGQRETQVLRLIAQGNSAKEVARILDISKNTVEVHRRNIMIKLKLRKSTELTRYAIENNLLDA